MNSIVTSIKFSKKKSCLVHRAKLFLSTLLFFLISLCTNKAHASHAVAAEITYQHITGLQYAVRVWFYRDCAGVAAPGNIVLNVTSSCGNAPNLTCTPIGIPLEVLPVCSTGVSTCNAGPVFGIKEHIYRGIITLPFACSNWRFSFQVCCRNFAITNILSPGSTSEYFFAQLNNLNVPANNSAKFNTKPVPFECTNDPFVINSGATDLDGDSLAYSLVAPSQSQVTNVNFAPGYTATTPLSSSPPMTMNSATGMINVWPLLQGIYVMAVQVREYRSGLLVGIIQRDMQVNLTFCPCLVPLPVELIKFAGNNYKIYNLLEWTTASETGNDYFEVERSSDGIEFKSIGTVKAAGNSSSISNYSFRDDDLDDDHYYRLKQMDFNGNSVTSEIVHILNYSSEKEIELYPIPFKNELNVYFSCKDANNYTISIHDIMGVLIRKFSYQKPEGSSLFTMNNFDLNNGVYFLEIESAYERKSYKIFSANKEISGN